MPINAVRLRPGMYFGGVDQFGLHELVRNVINYDVDKVLVGDVTKIDVVLYDENRISIRDNGAGLRVTKDSTTGYSMLEQLLRNPTRHRRSSFRKPYATMVG